jgi:hypothetical protein
LFGRPERDALVRVLREQEQRIGELEDRLAEAKAARNGILNVTDEWERRFFEQKRIYDELVFAQRKLIHEGVAAILNKEK